jgi:hypothetical protein
MVGLTPHKDRVLRWLFVACVASSAVIVLLWVVSQWRSVGFVSRDKTGRFDLRVHDGALFIASSNYPTPKTAQRTRVLEAPPLATVDPWTANPSLLSPIPVPPPADAAAVAAAAAARQARNVASANAMPGAHLLNRGFFGFVSFRAPSGFVVDIVPLWALLLALGVYQTWWLNNCYGRFVRRTRSGTCIECGYDLRASTERCPECGHPIGRGRVEAVPVVARRQGGPGGRSHGRGGLD